MNSAPKPLYVPAPPAAPATEPTAEDYLRAFRDAAELKPAFESFPCKGWSMSKGGV